MVILFYDEKQLEEILENSDTLVFLSFMGYDKYSNLEEKLSYLKSRYDISNFPHEIGIFLGYPY